MRMRMRGVSVVANGEDVVGNLVISLGSLRQSSKISLVAETHTGSRNTH